MSIHEDCGYEQADHADFQVKGKCVIDLPDDAEHACRVSIRHGRYVVVCNTCDVVGRRDGEEYEVDARAIAARHQEVGGFER